jgi:hypothetical protein
VYSESCTHGSEGRERDISKTFSFTRQLESLIKAVGGKVS